MRVKRTRVSFSNFYYWCIKIYPRLRTHHKKVHTSEKWFKSFLITLFQLFFTLKHFRSIYKCNYIRKNCAWERLELDEVQTCSSTNRHDLCQSYWMISTDFVSTKTHHQMDTMLCTCPKLERHNTRESRRLVMTCVMYWYQIRDCWSICQKGINSSIPIN